MLRVARVANRSPCPSVVRASHGISSYSYSAPAVLVLVLEDTASSTSTSTISLSTSTIKAKTAQLQNATADGARARWDASTRPSESLRNSPQRRQVRQVKERPTGHFSAWFCSGCFSCSCNVRHGLEVAICACFGVSIDGFPGFSYSYSALAVLVLVLVLENTASSTSTITLSTSTIKAKIAQLQKP